MKLTKTIAPNGMLTVHVHDDIGWISGEGSFTWPEGVRIVFPDGDAYDAYGSYEHHTGESDYDPSGTGAVGSPCHQVLLQAGLI